MKNYPKCIDCKKPLNDYNAKRCQSCAQKERLKNPINHPGYKDGRTLIKHYCIDCGKKLKLYTAKRCSKCYFKYMKTKWENCRYKENRLKTSIFGYITQPNKPEKILIKLFKYLKLPYKFVGDRSLIIKGFNPDFINKKQKKIIEMFGDYWHNLPDWRKRDKRKLRIYKKLGYKVLIIWQHEFKKKKILINKILKFNNRRK